MHKVCSLAFAAAALCTQASAQTVAGFTASPLNTCTGYVQFTDTSAGNPTQFIWDFGDGGTSSLRNPLHRYAANGTYTVTLLADGPNGADTATKAGYIAVNRPAAPPATGDTVQCGQNMTAQFTATAPNGGFLLWYDVPSGGSALDSGDTFSTAITQTTTFYVQENQVGSVQNVGPADSSFGAGTNHTQLNYGLVFDAQAPFLLKSVKVFAQGAGPRTIEVRTAVGGSLLHSKTVTLADGENRVALNFSMDPGTGYFIQINDVPNLFRNSDGASYPYTVPGVMSIVRSNAGGGASFTYYYYFYDWEVQEITCTSERAPAVGIVTGPAGPSTVNDTVCPGGGIVNLLATGSNGGKLNWYDAPNGGNLIDTGGVHSENITATVTYYVSEVVSSPAAFVGPPDNTFGAGNNFDAQNSLGLVFDVLAPLTIRSVKVYAQGTANRTINVYDAIGGNLVHTRTVNIPDGENRVSLNFAMNPGNGYYITTASPQNLYRNSSGASYPYVLADLIAIDSSNAGQPMNYYYFFYDWEVEPAPCESDRSPVSGVVRAGQALSLATDITDAGCSGGADGAVDLTVAGGTPPYAFLWSDGRTTEDASGLSAGNYSVTVTDVNGCTAADSVSVGEPAAIAVSATVVNAACGNSDGLIDITVSGGTPSYSYLWSTGGTSQDAGSLSAGSYTVTVTDSRGCVQTHTENVSNTGGTLVTSTPSGPSCNGGSDGAIDVTVTGAPNVTYLWNTGATTQDISGLSAGSYTVTVTALNGCMTLETADVNDPPALGLTADVTDASCNGSSDGAVDITVTGGSPAYSFLWSNGTTTEDAGGLSAGSYTITVTDANGCSDSLKPAVGEPGPITLTTSATDESCQPGSDGTATVTPSGGTGPYYYLWDDASSQTTATATGLVIGTYNVTVADQGGCLNTAQADVNKPGPVLATSAADASCNGGSDGSIDITVAGGTAPFSFAWSNGATTEDISGLTAGDYTVTVTDANGCSDSGSETVGEPTAIALTASVTDPSCGNSDGLIDLSVSGGSPAYTYLWSNGVTTQDAGGVPSGSYTVTVTDSKGCTATLTRNVNDQGGPAPLSAGTTDVSCNGGNDGTATVTPGGGTPAYTYLWSDGQTDQTATGLSAGGYNVTVADANGCTASIAVTVQEPTALATSAGITGVSCNGGSDGVLDLTPAGGTPAYTFAWDNGATTEDLSGLTAGAYTVTVTDGNGCTAADTFAVTEPPAITTVMTVQGTSCSGSSDGSATVTPSGGNAPYTYLWNDGTAQTDSSATGLTAGSYTVTVTDSDGCTTTANAVVASPNIVVAANTTSVSCNGGSDGSIDLTVAGGLGPYSFSWDNGGTAEDSYNLTAGTYNVTVTDANGCTATRAETVSEPAAIQITSSVTQPSCGNSDGLINITVTGGTPAYSYLWSHGATGQDAGSISAGTYTVTVTDANGCKQQRTENVDNASGPGPVTLSAVDVTCNGGADGSLTASASGGAPPLTYAWSNGATGQSLTAGAGSYTVTVTDNNGCTALASGVIAEPSALTLALAGADIACNGQSNGAIDLTATGGTPAYSYLWSSGETAEDLSGLTAGTYTVTVTDANGCTSADSATIAEPAPLTLTTSVTNASCSGTADGSATVTASGGTPGYTYAWDDAASQTTPTATGLSAGTYNVQVTDTAGCAQSAQVTVSQPTITTAFSATPASCSGAADGTIDLTAVGGAMPYSFAWSNGATTEDIGGLTAGTYNVTVTDANGCSKTGSETVTEPAAIDIAATVINSTCGNSNGLIDITVTGGSPGYAYQWSHGPTGQDAGSLAAGVYTVTVTDAAGCSKTLTRSVNDVGAPAVASAVTDVTCNGGSDGAIDLTVSGGAPGYAYSWSNGATTEDIGGLAAGSYNVTVTDAAGCTSTLVVTVNEPPVLVAGVTVQDETCFGCGDGSATVSATGGTPGYSYLWSDAGSQTTATATGLSTGTYYVTVTDANGCSVADSAVVSFSVGTAGVNGEIRIVLYPNPTRGLLHLAGDGLRYAETLSVLDMRGRTMHEGRAGKTLDLAAYPPGMYLVKVTLSDGSFSMFRVYRH